MTYEPKHGLDPRNLTPAVLTTDLARSLRQQYTDTLVEYDEAGDELVNAKAKNAKLERDYATALHQAAVDGGDLKAVPHPELLDLEPVERRVEVIEAAYAARADDLARQLLAALKAQVPDAKPEARQLADKATDAVRKAVATLHQALTEHANTLRVLRFHEALELWPDEIPNFALEGGYDSETARVLMKIPAQLPDLDQHEAKHRDELDQRLLAEAEADHIAQLAAMPGAQAATEALRHYQQRTTAEGQAAIIAAQTAKRS